jgi:hypothetical protein
MEGGISSGHTSTNIGIGASGSASDKDADSADDGGGSSEAPPSAAPTECTWLLTHITHGVMQDPVLDPEGNTYERHAIEQWLPVKLETMWGFAGGTDSYIARVEAEALDVNAQPAQEPADRSTGAAGDS